jgi:peptidoglycan/xylan/chitin deacetylase (PgdA/CDA1 family)
VKQSNAASHVVSGRDIGAERQSAFGRWRPAPVIRISAAVHLAGVAAVALDPLSWPYIGAALVANHAALGLGVMMPRSTILGPNLSSLPQASALRGEIALTFDDGPHPTVTPRLLDLLDRYGAKASFFCIGRKAAAYPEIVREIARRGHSVENHSNRHPNGFAGYGLRRLARDIEAAQETLGSLSGRAPAFFRAPMGLRSLFLDPVLTRLGLAYVSWTRRGLDMVDKDPASVLARLVRGLSAGDILLLHDGVPAQSDPDLAVVLSVLPALLERIAVDRLKPVSLRTACHE